MDDSQRINKSYSILEVIFYRNKYLMKKINTQLYVEQIFLKFYYQSKLRRVRSAYGP